MPLERILMGNHNVSVSEEARKHVTKQDLTIAMLRHFQGDCGEIDGKTMDANQKAKRAGHGTIMSQYMTLDRASFFTISTDLSTRVTRVDIA